MDTAVAEQWVVVRDDDYDANYSYDAARMQAGPFDTLAEANDYIGWDDRFIAIRRALRDTAVVSIPAPADGEWIVRSDVDDCVLMRGFTSYEDAAEMCRGDYEGYACQYRSEAWERAFTVLCRRADDAERAADSLDDSFGWTNLSLANDAISAVGDAYPDICEDDPITRFACYVVALEEAVAQAGEDYTEVRPRGSSSWYGEAFPKAALGLI